MTDASIDISFVVPAYNEARLIGDTLASLHEAGASVGGSYEIVVADDASEDATAAIARDQGARVVSVRHRQIAATRNAGARESRGALIIFVDADTRVPAPTVHATMGAVRHGVVAGGCLCEFDEPIPGWARRVEPGVMWLWRKARLTPGAYLFCTRAAFDAVGGFDESRFGGEEVIMARALDRYSKRVGQRFTVVSGQVVTSGRKLRAYTGREILSALLKAGVRGARSREGMDLWYGPRRSDPKDPDPM